MDTLPKNSIIYMKWTNSLKKHNLPRLTEGEVDYMNKPKPIKEMESVINSHSKTESTKMGSLVNCVKHLQKKLLQFSTAVSSKREQTKKKHFLTCHPYQK